MPETTTLAGRTGDPAIAGYREAPLLVGLLTLLQLELWVHELDELALLDANRQVDDDHPKRNADLRRREADSRSRVHRLDHVGHQGFQIPSTVGTGRDGSWRTGSPYFTIGRRAIAVLVATRLDRDVA